MGANAIVLLIVLIISLILGLCVDIYMRMQQQRVRELLPDDANTTTNSDLTINSEMKNDEKVTLEMLESDAEREKFKSVPLYFKTPLVSARINN